ncbi:MAG: response regulator transcription factor [Meiothermus sp.]|nr:response regulator transcription factor [Meiothermus sp.]
MPARVLIVSDDPWARAGLAGLLAEELGIEVVGQVDGEADFAPYQPEVLLWDLGSGLADWPDLDVPIVALVTEESQGMRVLSAGARAVLLRESDPEFLGAALVAVAKGLVVLEPTLLAHIVPNPDPDDLFSFSEPLTGRELEVLQLLALGMSNKALAQRLEISEHTAKFHVAQILSKLGVESRTEAVVRAVQLGLVLL